MKGMAKTRHFRTLVVSVAAGLAACLTILLLSARVTDAQTSSAYTVTDLGAPGGNYSYAYDINESGQVVGDSDGHAFLYDNGQMKDLGVLASSGGSSEAHGINDNGKVTGVSSADDPERGPGSVQHAFLYDSSQPNSQMQDLGYYPGNYPSSHGYAINNSDQIAGVTNGVRANLYQGGQWHDLGGGYQSYAYDINDSGAVVGRLETPVAYQGYHYTGIHAFLYQNGQIQDIDGSSSLRSEALGINDDGAVTGFRRDNSTGDFRAFLWTPSGGMQDLGVPQGVYPQSFGLDINNNGQIVGSAGSPEGAAIYENGQWKFLNALIPSDSGWNLQSAQAINDRGQIVGYGTTAGSTQPRAFLLTPGSSTTSDTTKPTLGLPSDMTEEAAGSDGAQVAYNATANDDTDGDVPVDCSPASGNTFPIGTTQVNCSASDAAGNQATGSFNVSVRDTTAPTIGGVPADITRTTTSASGAQVSYASPTANDAVDGSVPVNCSPASGSTFALGETTVSCSASDTRANTATKTFKLSVLYDFGNGSGGGFAEPVTNGALNQVKAGAGVPVKFGLGANLGLDIFAAGYPTSRKVTCDTQEVIDPIEETVAVSSSGLKYDATSAQYIYSWKTDKAWSSTCRQLVIKLKDGTEHPINFKFK